MTTTADRFRMLVQRLYNSNAAKRLVWQVTDVESAVQCDLGEFKVKLRSTRNAEGEPFERVEILDKDGRVIDSFNDTTISGQVPPMPGINSYYDLMREVRTQARRQATGADTALDKIIDSLDN